MMPIHQFHQYLRRTQCVVLAMLLVSITSLSTKDLRADLVFSAADDFSTLSNPNGVWNYGWTQTLGSPFNYHLQSFQDAVFDRWEGSVVTPISPEEAFPYVAKNRTNQTILFRTIQYLPGQMNLHPGPGGEYSVVRFVAPTSGQYSLSTAFGGMDIDSPASSDVHVLLNNNAIFSSVVNGFGTGPTFSSLLSLQAGDRIDFAVGFGSNGNFAYDSTSLVARIAAVPEPTSLLLLSSGGVGMFALGRRKNKNTNKEMLR